MQKYVLTNAFSLDFDAFGYLIWNAMLFQLAFYINSESFLLISSFVHHISPNEEIERHSGSTFHILTAFHSN